jgi:hypothetical protein
MTDTELTNVVLHGASTSDLTMPIDSPIFVSWPAAAIDGTVASCGCSVGFSSIDNVGLESALDHYLAPVVADARFLAAPSTTQAIWDAAGPSRKLIPDVEGCYNANKPSRIILHTTRTAPVFDASDVVGIGAAGHEALSELMSLVPLPADRLAPVLGASRRSLYNWSKGREPSAIYQSRIQRLRDVLKPLAAEWHPVRIAQWFEDGPDSPAELARRQRWDILSTLVSNAARARSMVETTVEADSKNAEAYPPDVQAAALAAFASPRELPVRRPSWRPKETTGASMDSDEDE